MIGAAPTPTPTPTPVPTATPRPTATPTATPRPTPTPSGEPTPPRITTFTPILGPVGTLVTITGSNFTGVTAVRFNERPATFTIVSDGEIRTTVPAGATTGRIAIANSGWTTFSDFDFSVGTRPGPGACTDGSLTVASSTNLALPPGKPFTLFFELRNTGACTWKAADGYRLALASGSAFGAATSQPVTRDVGPGEVHRWTIAMTAPAIGCFVGSTVWRAQHNATFFGSVLPIAINTLIRAADQLPSDLQACPSPDMTSDPMLSDGGDQCALPGEE